MKRYHKQCLIMVIIAAMFTGGLYATGLNGRTEAMAEEYKNTSKEDALEGIVETVAGVDGHGEGYDKEETVYVIGDAEGNTTEIIASDWLKNLKGSDRIEDESTLKDIVNVKGYEKYTKGDGDSLVWDADGNDIFYQGKTDKDIPVGVQVTYKLDGKKVTPEEIKGKSGRVEIRFDYKNATSETIEVDGETEEVSVPFTMLTGVILPNDIFQNVEVENGRLIADGSNVIVIGYAFPGLYDSLKYDDFKESLDEDKRDDAENLNISDHVTITADASDFELNSTLTVALPDVLKEVSFTDNIDTDEVKDDMDELDDAAQELIDGTEDLLDGVYDLKDGTGELRDGVDELQDGVNELKDGARDLKDGTEDLIDGTDELMDGAWDMREGACEAYGGSKKIYNGAKKLRDGAGSAYDGSVALKEGISSAYTGTKTLNSGINKLDKGANTLYKGAAAVSSGSGSLNEGLKSAYTGSKALNAGVGQLSENLISKSGDIVVLQKLADALAKNLEGESPDTADKTSEYNELRESSLLLASSLNKMDETNERSEKTVSMLSLKLESDDSDEDGTDPAEQLVDAKDAVEGAAEAADTVGDAISELIQLMEERSEELKNEREELSANLIELGEPCPEPDNEGGYSPDSDEDDEDEEDEDEEDEDEDEDKQTVKTEDEKDDKKNSEDEDKSDDDDEEDEDSDDEEDKDDHDEDHDDRSSEDREDYLRNYYNDYYRDYYEKYFALTARIDALNYIIDWMDEAEESLNDVAGSSDETAEALYKSAGDIEEIIGNVKEKAERNDARISEYVETVISANSVNREAARAVTEVVTQLEKMDIISVDHAAAMPFAGMTAEEIGDAMLSMDSDTLNQTITGLLTTSASADAATKMQLQAQLNAVVQYISSDSEKLAVFVSKVDPAILSTLMGGNAELAKKVSAGVTELADTLTSDEMRQNLTKLSAGAGDLEGGLKILSEGSSSLNEGIKKLYDGAGDLKDGTGTLSDGSKTLKEGMKTLYTGSKTLSGGLDELDSGARTLRNGAEDLREGLSELSDGGVELYDGAVDLSDGAKDLDEGAEDLNDGVEDLLDGVDDLADGAEELDDGADDLLDGVEELHDGVIEFNDEGIQKLIDLFGDSVADMLDRLDAIHKTGAAYQTFSGKRDDMEGSVKFILKTGEIKADDE